MQDPLFKLDIGQASKVRKSHGIWTLYCVSRSNSWHLLSVITFWVNKSQFCRKFDLKYRDDKKVYQ